MAIKRFLLLWLAVFVVFFPARVNSASKELAVEDIVKKYSDSIVVVGATGSKGSSFGSGFIVSANGLIVTNLHIFQKAVEIGVKLKNGKTYNDVRLLHFDQERDLAILKIDELGLKPVMLGNSRNVQAGEKVIVIGNPLGLESTVSDGLVSSIRKVDRGFKVLQITVPISTGSSGSPLFNLRGEVIGVVVGTMVSGQNINFAIPINYITPALASYRGFKGPQPRNSTVVPRGDSGYYVVKSGDTLYALARKFNTSIKALMELNNLTGSSLFIGKKLKIPNTK